VDTPAKALTNPNDPDFAQQWAFNEVPYVAAWSTDATTGAGSTVAVIDTGVMANHPDLGLSPNGPILAGEYFLHSNDGQTAFQGAGGTNDPNGHGTHVSGIIAALTNNGIGISGAAPGVKVLPVQVLCSDGTGWNSDVANGITWAVDHGANVINLSLGANADSALQAAITYANSKNVVVVAAAGNTGQNGNTPVYPAAYSTQLPDVIAVAATTNATPPAHASYSTSGNYIDVAAPGGNACGCGSGGEVLSTWNDGGYRSISGTSMATPYVSAAAALLRAANSTCTPDKVRTRLMNTANTNLNAGSGNFQQQFGAGLVDPNKAATSCP
jgi:subtilisin family serine protease